MDHVCVLFRPFLLVAGGKRKTDLSKNYKRGFIRHEFFHNHNSHLAIGTPFIPPDRLA